MTSVHLQTPVIQITPAVHFILFTFCNFQYFTGGVFIVIVVGIGLAFITLIFEYWYYKNKDPEERKDQITNKSSNSKVKQVTFTRNV
jgi:uncharacterized membrane protein